MVDGAETPLVHMERDLITSKIQMTLIAVLGHGRFELHDDLTA